MAETRVCPRCKTENPTTRSNCLQCGGVMLGVGMGDQLGTPLDLSDPSVPPQIPRALHRKLESISGLDPQKREIVEQVLLRAAARQQAQARQRQDGASKPGARAGCVVVLALGVFSLVSGSLLFLEATVSLPESVRANLPPEVARFFAVRAAPSVPLALPASPAAAGEEELATDPLAADPASEDAAPRDSAPLLAAPAAAASQTPGQAPVQTPGQTLTRATLQPVRSCFVASKPAKLPMTLGLELQVRGKRVTSRVFPLAGAQLPPGLVACLQRGAATLGLGHGVYFIDWPDQPDWP